MRVLRRARGTATDVPTRADLQEALAVVRDAAVVTPVRRLRSGRGLLKCESEQVTRSFKFRGAWFATSRTVAGHVVAGSSGNHGLAVARSAALRGIRATVFMTATSSAYKQELVRQAGAELVVVDGDNEERDRRARRFAMGAGHAFVSSHEDPAVIAGQATVAAEVLRQVPGVTDLYVPVGGGGLLAGTCLAAQDTGVRVVGVEPEGAARFATAGAAGAGPPLAGVETICDGARAAAPGELPLAITAVLSPALVSVSDGLTAAAWSRLAAQGLRVETTGALAVAGLLADRAAAGACPVAVVSGANVP